MRSITAVPRRGALGHVRCLRRRGCRGGRLDCVVIARRALSNCGTRSMRGQRSRQNDRLGRHVDGRLPGRTSADQPGADDHRQAAGWPAVAGRREDILRREPASSQGHAAVTAAARDSVRPVQTAADTAADDGSDAGRAAGAGGSEPSGEFARRPAQRAGCRLARRRVTDATGGGIAGFAGHRGASRHCDRRPALAWADAQPSLVGILSCVFSLSRDSLAATQESPHTF